jgi:O-acetyl-ADP-ribose deacetylase (regulator of RNase III)
VLFFLAALAIVEIWVPFHWRKVLTGGGAILLPHYGDGQATAESIRDATRNALDAADDRGAMSLVIPALGAGSRASNSARVPGYSEEIASFDAEVLEDVRFITYSGEEYEAVRAVADEVRERRGE